MLVEWNNPNLFVIYAQGKTDHPAVKLLPGMNTVEKENWDLVADRKDVQHYIEEDELVVHDDVEGSDGADITDDISGIAVKKANQIVKKTFDLELLGKWLESESRATVKKAIEAQIKKVHESVKVKTED